MAEDKSQKKLINEQELDRKAMYFWSSAGKPEGQYLVYRQAVERWNKNDAIDSEFDQYLKVLRDEEKRSREIYDEQMQQLIDDTYQLREDVDGRIQALVDDTHQMRKDISILLQNLLLREDKRYIDQTKNFFIKSTRLPTSRYWPWLGDFLVPIVVAGIAALTIGLQIWAAAKNTEAQINENRRILEKTFEREDERKRQEITNQYIEDISSMLENGLRNKYPKNEKGEYDPKKKIHPDAKLATEKTHDTLKRIAKEGDDVILSNLLNFNEERTRILKFLYSSSQGCFIVERKKLE